MIYDADKDNFDDDDDDDYDAYNDNERSLQHSILSTLSLFASAAVMAVG